MWCGRRFGTRTSPYLFWSKEVEKSNFRQYGQMKRWEESEKRKEERTSKKRKSQKKEAPGARKGREVVKHFVFPMICGSGGSKSRLAKAAGAEPAGQMRDEKLRAVVARSTFASEKAKNPLLEVEMSNKCKPLWREAQFEVKKYKPHHVQTVFGSWDVEKVHAVVARSTVRSQKVQTTPRSDRFWKLRCRKSARRCGAKHISSQNVKSITCSDRFWTFRCRFAWQARGIVHLVKSEQNVRVLWHVQKRWQALGHLKRICEDAFSAAGAVQETCSSELLEGPSADFLREEVSQNCFVFDVVNFENSGCLAELFSFWCCQVQNLRKSCRLVSFLTLSNSKIEEVSQNSFVLDVAKLKNWGSLAELLRFQACS